MHSNRHEDHFSHLDSKSAAKQKEIAAEIYAPADTPTRDDRAETVAAIFAEALIRLKRRHSLPNDVPAKESSNA